jgi:hypothetical protein
MRSRAQRPSEPSRPSTKPLLMVAGLLLVAATGAVVTTRPAPAPVRHNRPTPIVVSRLNRPGMGLHGGAGRLGTEALAGPNWI